MMNELQIFQNDDFGEIRTVMIDNEPWFVAADVCKILELTNPTVSMERLDNDEKAKLNLGLKGGDTNCVNEYGLYTLVLGSRKPEAKAFKRWITHDVIPQIRKTGSYHLPQTYAQALRELADKAEENERLLLENKEMKPKAEFFDAVTDSKDAFDMKDVANVLNYPGLGRNKLFGLLREWKILTPNNRPYQEYIDRGYFRTIEQRYDKPYGEAGVNIKTLVFQKGVDFIRKRLDTHFNSEIVI